jgi:hypothetical protein
MRADPTKGVVDTDAGQKRPDVRFAHGIITVAAKNSRNATVPELPTVLNRCLANAEPSGTLTMPSSTSAGSGIAPKVRPAGAVREGRQRRAA